MTARHNDFVEYCIELLGGPGSTRAKRMFSGYGLYYDDLFIAIVLRDQLYLKADDNSAARFAQAGCEKLQVHASTDRPIEINYWSVPPEAMDSPALLEPWRRLAIAAALEARQKKTPKKKK